MFIICMGSRFCPRQLCSTLLCSAFIVDVFPRPIIRNPYLRRTLSFHLVMLVVVLSSTLSLAQETNSPDPIPDAPKQATTKPKSFFARWADFYQQDWSGTTTSSPSP